MTLSEAQALVKLQCDYLSDPALTSDEVDDIVARHVRATVWASATAYAYGDKVIPTERNGKVYRCIEGGTSGATEPTFPEVYYGRVTDGTAEWEEAGPDWDSLYDTDAATREAWLLKASKAAKNFDFEDKAQQYKLSQIRQNCLQMADRYIAPEVF